MFGYDWPRFHAAVNDLPAALLFVTVLFDFGAWLTRRESLKAAALWTLWAGAIGGWIAVIAGLEAEDVIEHGDAIHDLMGTHKILAITTMCIFTAILGWKLMRRARLAPAEELGVRVLSVAGLVGIVWTGMIGGRMVFDHAAGVPSATMQLEIRDRAAEHHHHDAEDEHDTPKALSRSPAESATATPHSRPAAGAKPPQH